MTHTTGFRAPPWSEDDIRFAVERMRQQGWTKERIDAFVAEKRAEQPESEPSKEPK
jgi:hypothetical protein